MNLQGMLKGRSGEELHKKGLDIKGYRAIHDIYTLI